MWQVKVGFSHHIIDFAQEKIRSEKALCFCLDAKREDDPAEPPKKKLKKSKIEDNKKDKDTKKAGHFDCFCLT